MCVSADRDSLFSVCCLLCALSTFLSFLGSLGVTTEAAARAGAGEGGVLEVAIDQYEVAHIAAPHPDRFFTTVTAPALSAGDHTLTVRLVCSHFVCSVN